MPLPQLPLWSVGAVLILVGPWAVQKIADAWSKRVEKRTDEALAAAVPRDEKAASQSDAGSATEETKPTDSGAGGSEKR